MDTRELHIGDTIYHWSYGPMKIVDFYRYENGIPVSVRHSEADYVWAEFLDREGIVTDVPPLPPIPWAEGKAWLYEDVSRTIESPTENRKTFRIKDFGYVFHLRPWDVLLVDPLRELMYPLKKDRFHQYYRKRFSGIEDFEKLETQYKESKSLTQQTRTRIDRFYQSLDDLREKTRATVSPEYIEDLRDSAKNELEQFDASISEKQLRGENPDKLKESLVVERGPLEVRFKFLEHMLDTDFTELKNRQNWENALEEYKSDLLNEAKANYTNPNALKKYEQILESELQRLSEGVLAEFFGAVKLLSVLEKVLSNRSPEQDLTWVKDTEYFELFADLPKEQQQLKIQTENIRKLERQLETAQKALSDIGKDLPTVKARLKDSRYVI